MTRRSLWVARSAAALFMVIALALGTALSLRQPAVDTHVYRSTFVPPANLVNLAGGRLALSPDGRRLAFTAPGPDGRVVLWVRALDGLTAQPLAGTEDAAAPFWSPDSRFLAFGAGGKLKKIDASGGPVFTVSDTPAPGYAWNRDDVILFSRTLSEAGSSPLFRVGASGGPGSAVMALHDGEIFQIFATFLPDGRHFLYSSGTSTYVGSLDSGERTRLFDGFTNAQYTQGHVLFVRGTTLWAQPFDATRLTLSGQPVPLAEHLLTNAEAGAFSVSETGVLAYQALASDDEESRLVWFDRAGHEISVLGDRAAYDPGACVSLSPDGRRVVVTVKDVVARGLTGVPKTDIWIFDIARGLRSRFTFDPAVARPAFSFLGAGGPIWSPDGRRVVFGSTRKGHMDLYQQAASGAGTEELLLADGVDKAPTSWSPDGRFILYNRSGRGLTPTGDMWVLPLFGDRKPFPFLQSPFDEDWAQFSPDGRWVAYESDESGRREVYVTPFPGHGEKWQVSTAGGLDPRWRHDGREIFFLSGATTPQAPRAASKLMAASVRVDGPHFEVGAVQPLFDVRTPAYGQRVYDVSADGRFLINTLEDRTPITIVVNWPALLRK